MTLGLQHRGRRPMLLLPLLHLLFLQLGLVFLRLMQFLVVALRRLLRFLLGPSLRSVRSGTEEGRRGQRQTKSDQQNPTLSFFHSLTM